MLLQSFKTLFGFDIGQELVYDDHNIRMLNKVVKALRLLDTLKAGFSEVAKTTTRAPAR